MVVHLERKGKMEGVLPPPFRGDAQHRIRNLAQQSRDSGSIAARCPGM